MPSSLHHNGPAPSTTRTIPFSALAEAEHRTRIERARQTLAENRLDGAICVAPEHIFYFGGYDAHTHFSEHARVNVMAYRAGDALNWHFDRSEFTTTCLLQAPAAGGEFQYRSALRSAADP